MSEHQSAWWGFCKSASVRTQTIRQSDNQTVSQCQNSVSEAGTYGDCAQPRSRGRLLPETDRVPRPPPVALPRVVSESRQSEDPTRMDGPENTGNRVEAGEAIVVGAIGSAAPWFLTGWAHDVEMSGCQVIILSTTVFQRMCTVNQVVCFALQPCRSRLVSADSSPLMVQGQLELDIVFPGLDCAMMFVVASIGSDGLLGTEALQSYLPHQLDLQTCQLWADGWSTLQLHQHRLTPDLDGLLTTSVVIPPDSDIVAKFSVSGIRPHGCTLVYWAPRLYSHICRTNWICGQVSCGQMDGLRCSCTNID